MINIDYIWIEIYCPKCQYQIDVQLIDVKNEKTIFCHNCKININLIDKEASTHKGVENINTSLKNLEKQFKTLENELF